MPYRKRYNNKKYKKKTQYYKHGMNALNMASKSLAVAYGIKRLMNVEFKFIDTTNNNMEIPNAAGIIVQLTNIIQGDTDITRDGAQIKLMSLDFKADVVVDSAGATTGDRVAIFLVEDRQTNGVVYTTADLLADATAGDSLVSHLNLDNKYRFRVLKRWNMSLNLVGRSSVSIRYHKNFGNNMKLRYSTNNGNITDLASRSLSLLFIGNAGANTPQTTFSCRIRFVDN